MDLKVYREKTLGGWLGKNIGGTLGGPWEGQTCPLFLYYYDPVPTEPMPNDDFELQLVWLDMLRKRGIFIKPIDFVNYWMNHTKYNISEYFNGRRNMSLGLLPPVTGSFNNWWKSGMGAAIRSEIWGMIAPGLPDIAAAYAYLDASTDHAEDGVYCEVFLAAAESAAFTQRDSWEIVGQARSFIPNDSVLADALDFVVAELKKNTPIRQLRHLLCARYAHPSDFTYAPLNVAFIVLGWLSSEDFSEALCNAVNCGYDTDCTGATLGALLGIQRGAQQIPEEWLKPIGSIVKVSDMLCDIEIPETLESLTEMVCQIGQEVISHQDEVRHHLLEWTNLNFLRDSKCRGFFPKNSEVILFCNDNIQISVDYGDTPTILPNTSKTFVLSLKALKNTEIIHLNVKSNIIWDLSFDNNEKALEILCTPSEKRSVALHARLRKRETETNSYPVSMEMSVGTSSYEVTYFVPVCPVWLVTKPLATTDVSVQQIEESGKLCGIIPTELLYHPLDDLKPLIPAEGFVRFLESWFFSPRDCEIRLIANNTGPIRVFVNQKRVINKTHWLAGIMPSWHLQSCNTHLLPKQAGWADVVFHRGWNQVLIRLEGHKKDQDATFHIVLKEKKAGAPHNGYEFVLPIGIHNTQLPPKKS